MVVSPGVGEWGGLRSGVGLRAGGSLCLEQLRRGALGDPGDFSGFSGRGAFCFVGNG